MPEYQTVTLVVEYDPTKTRTPDDWNWDSLVDGTARVLHAWPSEFDELNDVFDDVCVQCQKPIRGDDPVYATSDGTAAGPPIGEPYHVGCLGPDPDALHCDLCDKVESAADLTPDWNGGTGNHRSCEEAARA